MMGIENFCMHGNILDNKLQGCELCFKNLNNGRHYHYLCHLVGCEGRFARSIMKTDKKLSEKSILEIEEQFGKQFEGTWNVISFNKLECDCDE